MPRVTRTSADLFLDRESDKAKAVEARVLKLIKEGHTMVEVFRLVRHCFYRTLGPSCATSDDDGFSRNVFGQRWH
jgi:hypothetical protein